MAEWIKATHTDAGSTPAVGGIFLLESHGVQRKVPPFHSRAWQIPTGYECPLKNLPKPKTHAFKTHSTLPHSRNHPIWPISGRGSINKK